MTIGVQLDESDAARRVHHAELATVIAIAPVCAGVVGYAIGRILGPSSVVGAPARISPWSLGFTLCYAGLYLIAWRLLVRRARSGALLAGALFLWMLVDAVRQSPVWYLNVLYALVALFVLARAWPALGRTLLVSVP